jgi:Spy/CpxP family protein refolding chaperone
MMRMGRGMGGAQPAAMILARKDVKADLGVTDEQTRQIEDAQKASQEKMMSVFQELRAAGGPPDREAMQAAFQKLQKESDAEIAKILKPEQQTRLKEITIQLAGNQAITREDVQKALEITADQKAKIKALQDKSREANQSVMEKMRNGEIQRDEIQAIMTKNGKVMNDELGKLLTEAQKKKLTEMGGKKFEQKDEEGN